MDAIVWTILIAGVLIALLGWMIYWTGIHVIGAFVGAGAGMAVCYLIASYSSAENSAELLLAVGALFGGVFGVLLVRMVQNAFFFFIGAAFGAPLAWHVMTSDALPEQGWAQSDVTLLAGMLVGGLAGGYLTLRFSRYLVALVAAFLGSAMIALSLPFEEPLFVALPAFITSIVVQTNLIRKFVPKEKLPEKPKPARAKEEEKPTAT